MKKPEIHSIDCVGLLRDGKTYRMVATLKKGPRFVEHNIDVDRAIIDRYGEDAHWDQLKVALEALGCGTAFASEWEPITKIVGWRKKDGTAAAA